MVGSSGTGIVPALGFQDAIGARLRPVEPTKNPVQESLLRRFGEHLEHDSDLLFAEDARLDRRDESERGFEAGNTTRPAAVWMTEPAGADWLMGNDATGLCRPETQLEPTATA